MKIQSEKFTLLVPAIFAMLFAITISAQKPSMDWSEIPAGTFTMGSPLTEAERDSSETQHQVTLSSFKMSKYEVTVRQFKAFVDATGYITDADKGTGGHKGSAEWKNSGFEFREGVNWKCDAKGNLRPESEYNNPVIHVSWNDAVAFAKWLDCRLPTEAEWEYACRAGTSTPFNTGEDLTVSQANYNGNDPYKNHKKGIYREKTMPVGSFPPNAWGLYDMHGNVWEWCSDWYDDYPTVAQTNPKGPDKGTYRVGRGGCWRYDARYDRSACRYYTDPDYRFINSGFRLVKGR